MEQQQDALEFMLDTLGDLFACCFGEDDPGTVCCCCGGDSDCDDVNQS